MHSIKFVLAFLFSFGSLNTMAQEFSKCKFRQALQLNTSATSAGIKRDLYNFPIAIGIGNQSQFPERGGAWDGILDETRVYNVPKNEYWIKLYYESQRKGQQTLTYGKKNKSFKIHLHL